jgi:hypothetical protein
MVTRLYDLGMQEWDICNLHRFMDWVMILPRGLKAEFWRQFQQFEQERHMPYITSVERIGYERGEKTVVLRQLKKRMGDIPEEL